MTVEHEVAPPLIPASEALLSPVWMFHFPQTVAFLDTFPDLSKVFLMIGIEKDAVFW